MNLVSKIILFMVRYSLKQEKVLQNIQEVPKIQDGRLIGLFWPLADNGTSSYARETNLVSTICFLMIKNPFQAKP